ncbi:GyrI-like domain-containing protein [Arthrobacter pityocampae]|uniref:GyrI-like domain-containing protein n=1 Tax=Arthrobacter pityocampae TaxID=547334 RepID=UPI003736FEF7
MTTIRIREHDEQLTAGVRERVPMPELTGFFSRAFQETMAALLAQGMQPTGAPFGKYYGPPGAVVDVEAGFPVAVAIAPSGNVVPGRLPAGRVAEAVHIGSFDTMADTYSALERYLADAKLVPDPVVWESYLSDPEVEPDPATWRTEVCWPVHQG